MNHNENAPAGLLVLHSGSRSTRDSGLARVSVKCRVESGPFINRWVEMEKQPLATIGGAS